MSRAALAERPRASAPAAGLRRISGNLHASGLRDLWNSLWSNRALVWNMAKREVEARYRGSMAGLLWSVLTPLIMLGVYTFVFGYVMKGGGADRSAAGLTRFAVYVYSGLVFFNFFSACLLRAPNLVLDNANYVKKVVFPVETLCWTALGAALFDAMMGLAVLAAFAAAATGTLHPTVLLLPLVLLPLVLMTAGLVWFFSALGVFLRDASQVIGLFTMFLMFMSPIFYDASSLPAAFRICISLNPIAVPVDQFRRLLLAGLAPDWQALTAYAAASVLAAWAGFAWFQKFRRGFADVL